MGYFYNRFSNDALNKAYELLEDTTPLKGDCGELCGCKCCRGGDADGMLLFPGEEEYYMSKDGFKITKDGVTGYSAVVCEGRCNRTDRPLSCRIFPLFPYAVEENGRVTCGPSPDTRAFHFCPLLEEKYEPCGEFKRKMRILSKVLVRDEEIRTFLIDVSKIITDFGVFSETQE